MKKQLHRALLIIVLIIIFIISCFVYVKKAISRPETNVNDLEKSISNVKEKSVSILFVGDMMFDRYVRQTRDKKGSEYIFAGVKDMFSGNDLIVGNLEGPITDNKSVSVSSKIGEKNNYIFTFDPSIAEDLRSNNIGIVNIGNNHILNFGESGLDETRKNLQKSGVDFFGDPGSEKRIAFWNENGMRIALVSYNQFESDAKNKTINDLKTAKQEGANVVIIYAHWGAEFVLEPSNNIKDLAHDFIDSGADLIIGSHPHVVQSNEEYKGKKIYYSLGNFFFDQFFEPNTQKGLAVKVEIGSDKKMQFQEFEVKMNTSGQTVKK